MFEDFSKRNKAIRAALELAQERDWGDITLADIARQAGLDLADLRREFACKSDIVRAFQAEVDAEVLAKAKPPSPDANVRDRVFDMLMTRFEVMGPYKPALKRIARYLRRRPGESSLLACSTLASQYWMLAGAGAKLDGARGAVRVAGLTAIYSRAFRVWMEDTSPTLDKTMAALDRSLSSGERTLNNMEKACGALCGFLPRGWKRRSEPKDQPPPEAGPAPAASV